MEVAIDDNVALDYIEFHILTSQNRYEACVCYLNKKEKVASGLLEHLLLHSTEIKALHSKGLNAKFVVSPPENSHDVRWFTKATLIRFLHIIGSANILEVTSSLRNEICQLEEARRFHISLYTKGTSHQLGESDGSYSNSTESTTEVVDSDASKNELLQAMDLRLTALMGELTAAFDQATGSTYSVEQLAEIEKFSRHFGSVDLSDSLLKHIEPKEGILAVENPSSNQMLERDSRRSKEGNHRTNESLSSEAPVRYSASPAKVAQVERRSSTGSDESSFSSEEDRQPERSRTLIRSASPRRSASPMRRVQIGRTGTRRSTAITIKSLNYIPARERSFFPKDTAASDSEGEGSQQAPKKSENNVRISVQDAISLFESKQRDQTVNIQKARSSLNASNDAKKSVLRRWSSGMGEDSLGCRQDTSSEDVEVKIQNNIENRDNMRSSPESECKPDDVFEDNPIESHELDAKLNSPEKGVSSPVIVQDESLQTESTDADGKLTASAEWSRKKEAELNELLMKMMETKPTKSKTAPPVSSKRQSLPPERRGGLYNHYKEKRDEKLRGEATGKKAEKEKQLSTMQQILDSKYSNLASANASDSGRKYNVKKIQKPQKSTAEPANLKNESPKTVTVKKASVKGSSLPATRKSWPSIPSARAPGLSPVKTPPSTSSGTTPAPRGPGQPPVKTPPGTSSGTAPASIRRRSLPTPPVSHSNQNVETNQTRARPVKSKPNDSKRSLGNATEKKQQSVTKPRKPVKSKAQTSPEDLTSAAKPSLYNKVTKKSSVVPLESKPFLRKSSGAISSVNPPVKKKVFSSPQGPRTSEDLSQDEGNATVSHSSDPVIEHEEREIGETTHTTMESGTAMSSPQKHEVKEGISQVEPTTDDVDRVVELELELELKPKPEDEKETISPTAWVEIEEHECKLVTSEELSSEIVGSSPAYVAPIGGSSPRVRHSLSQMLLEESSEPDANDWGNAENPPQVVYHKDAPKGLKRLLKFARKSKTEANAAGWSSPSVFSEGEDDSEDSKSINKRSAENLLRKATLHSKNNGHSKNSTDNKHAAQSFSHQFQEGPISASVTTAKATRSFFSLSAFKGSK